MAATSPQRKRDSCVQAREYSGFVPLGNIPTLIGGQEHQPEEGLFFEKVVNFMFSKLHRKGYYTGHSVTSTMTLIVSELARKYSELEIWPSFVGNSVSSVGNQFYVDILDNSENTLKNLSLIDGKHIIESSSRNALVTKPTVLAVPVYSKENYWEKVLYNANPDVIINESIRDKVTEKLAYAYGDGCAVAFSPSKDINRFFYDDMSVGGLGSANRIGARMLARFMTSSERDAYINFIHMKLTITEEEFTFDIRAIYQGIRYNVCIVKPMSEIPLVAKRRVLNPSGAIAGPPATLNFSIQHPPAQNIDISGGKIRQGRRKRPANASTSDLINDALNSINSGRGTSRRTTIIDTADGYDWFSTNPQEGDLINVIDSGEAFVFTGSTWRPLAEEGSGAVANNRNTHVFADAMRTGQAAQRRQARAAARAARDEDSLEEMFADTPPRTAEPRQTRFDALRAAMNRG